MSCTGWFQLQLAAHHLGCGGVIAHATEGVWGLACDPFNECAVMELATLKQRSGSKGFILIADSLERFGFSHRETTGVDRLLAQGVCSDTLLLALCKTDRLIVDLDL